MTQCPFCLCRKPRLVRCRRPRFRNGRVLWHCKNCDLYQLFPYPVSGNDDVRMYCRPDYNSWIREEEYYGYFRALYDFALCKLIAADSCVLDFGAGSCHYQKFLQELGYRKVYSVEPNRHLVEVATKCLGLRNVFSSLEELPPVKFDLIYANQVLEHLFDPVELMCGPIAARLRPGGHFVFSVPNFDSLNRRLLGSRWVGWSPEEHIWFFNPSSVRKLVEISRVYEVRSVMVKSSLSTPHDGFRPRSFLKRTYYQTVMRIFEALGRGDQLIVVLRLRS
jgi:SAM-dependent methyltransferase